MALERDWIFAQCLALPGAWHDYKEAWGADRFMIDDKMFAMLGGDKQGTPILTVKAEPAMGEALRAQYPDIQPGYYMNKQHWNSITLEGGVPEDLAAQMIAGSHKLILSSLSKKRQAEIRET